MKRIHTIAVEEPIVLAKRPIGRPRKIINLNTVIVAKPIKPVFKQLISHVIQYGTNNAYLINSNNKKNKYNMSFGPLYVSPTNNCQMMSFASFNNLITIYQNDKQGFNKILDHLPSIVGKRLMLVDINEGHVTILRKLLEDTKKTLILDQTYTSTNGSEMHMFLIKLK